MHMKFSGGPCQKYMNASNSQHLLDLFDCQTSKYRVVLARAKMPSRERTFWFCLRQTKENGLFCFSYTQQGGITDGIHCCMNTCTMWIRGLDKSQSGISSYHSKRINTTTSGPKEH